MSEIFNLRMARKRKARVEAERVAAERRAEFGVSKSDKHLARARGELAERALDAHKVTPRPIDDR